jgi:hypothetical protein
MLDYLNQIILSDPSIKPQITGGIPINAFSTTVFGGNGSHEGITKISHLSVPIGLFISKQPRYETIPPKNIIIRDDCDINHRKLDLMQQRIIFSTSKTKKGKTHKSAIKKINKKSRKHSSKK